MLPFVNNVIPKLKKYIFLTRDHSGEGFAKHAMEEVGHENVLYSVIPKDDEENFESLDLVGNGIVEKIDWDELWKNRTKYKDFLWVVDGNHNPDKFDQLRKEGFQVFGSSQLQFDMENDRAFGMQIVQKAGLDTLPYVEFSSPEEGIEYLELSPDKAYVFKPDSGAGCYTTYVPDNEDDEEANEELRRYMTALDDDGTTYILQERIKGLEFNVEAWIYKGTPFFAFADLECKRKLNKDEGEMVGCAHDCVFSIPLGSKVLHNTVYKVLKQLPADYTGFLDVNILNKDKKDYFIEFCARWGYNSHPNLIWNLAISPLTTILSDFMAGDIKDFYRHFRHGFGTSITLYIDHEKKGLPFEKVDNLKGHFYHFDTYMEDENYYLAGYGNEVGIVMGHGFTIKEAGEEALKNGNKIHYPMHAFRTDIDKNDYPLAPQGRYDALVHMGYFLPKGDSDV